MSKNSASRNLMVLFVLLFFMFACSKNEVLLEDISKFDKEVTLSTAEAQQWYNENIGRVQQNSKESGDDNDKMPDWKAVKQYNKSKNAVIEIPIYYAKQLAMRIKGDKDIPLSQLTKEEAKQIEPIANLLIIKGKDGIIYSRIVHIVGTTDFRKKKNYQIKNNSFERLEKDFSGALLFSDWSGVYQGGFYYQDGEQLGTMALVGGYGSKPNARLEYQGPGNNITIEYYFYGGIISGGGTYTIKPGTADEQGFLPVTDNGGIDVVTITGLPLTPQETGIVISNTWMIPILKNATNSGGPSIKFYNPSDETTYPKFAQVCKNLQSFVRNNPKVLNSLMKYANIQDKEKLLLMLKYGQGPIVKVMDFPQTTKYGHFTQPATLEISKYFIQKLESSNTTAETEALSFLMSVTVLHEFVHYGRSVNEIGETINGVRYEFGNGFEAYTFGTFITFTNAEQYYYEFIKK